MLGILYALVPSLCNIVALGIALFYLIDSQTHEEIRRAVEAGKSVPGGGVEEGPLLQHNDLTRRRS